LSSGTTRAYQHDNRRDSLTRLTTGFTSKEKNKKAHQEKNQKRGRDTIRALDRVTPYQPVASAEGRAATG
jgi:5-methylcytosine-specific restriction endonuclease McrBC regulatory subunit McrC